MTRLARHHFVALLAATCLLVTSLVWSPAALKLLPSIGCGVTGACPCERQSAGEADDADHPSDRDHVEGRSGPTELPDSCPTGCTGCASRPIAAMQSAVLTTGPPFVAIILLPPAPQQVVVGGVSHRVFRPPRHFLA